MKEILRELLGREEFLRLMKDMEYGRISFNTCVEIVKDEKEVEGETTHSKKGQPNV